MLPLTAQQTGIEIVTTVQTPHVQPKKRSERISAYLLWNLQM